MPIPISTDLMYLKKEYRIMVEESKKKKMGSKGKRKKEESTEENVHVHVEEDFPRGGGSGLAPVELKRIQKVE